MELVLANLEYELEFAQFYEDFKQLDVENAGYYQQGKVDNSSYIRESCY